jgi:hypothetical protein
MLEHTRLLELLLYDPCTGVFRWRVRRASNALPKNIAGCVSSIGYRYVTIDRKRYLAHRLAWFYVTGKWPIAQIDHCNGDGLDNRLSNLREATRAQNGYNRKATNAKSGIRGVRWHPEKHKWQAYIKRPGRQHHIGYYNTSLAAEVARGQAAAIFQGKFASF